MATARRDIQALTDTIAAVKPGDLVVATFKTPRYGSFKIKGTTTRSLDKKVLTVGSWLLNTKEKKPAKGLQELTIKAVAGEHDNEITPGSDAPEHYGN